jgi:hypothetical protein
VDYTFTHCARTTSRSFSSLLYEIDGTITKIDVRPVVDGYERVVDYVFKTIKRGRVSYDEGVLILPRTRDELTLGACHVTSR